MDIHLGGTYRHLPSGLPCVVEDLSRVSGRAMVKLENGVVVHDVGSHELADLPAPAPAPEPEPESTPATPHPEVDPAEDVAPTPRRRFGRSAE